MENQQPRIYKKVKGFENYLVSNFGEIINLKSGRKLKACNFGNGYKGVNLYKNKKYFSKSIHRLVGIAFIDNPENKPQINHKDGNKHNNNINNLEWNTSSENLSHRYTTGLYSQKGFNNSNSKMTEKDLNTISVLILEGCSNREIGRRLNYSSSTINYNVKKYKLRSNDYCVSK